jgi:hypothetical protein
MALFWLKAVPWSTIVSNAPLIVDGAKALANLARSKAGAAAQPASSTLSGDPQTDLTALSARVQQLEREQRQAADLLRSMAESNAQLAQAVDALRRRAVRNMWLAWIALAGLALLGTWSLLR